MTFYVNYAIIFLFQNIFIEEKENFMKKKFFAVLIFFMLSLAVVVGILAYNTNKVQAINSSLEELEKSLAMATPSKELSDFDVNQRLYEQCYAEIVWQSNQDNLLYCLDLEQPVIRAVAENNWNLIEDASIFNTSSQADLTIIEVSPCTSGIKEFSYLPADDITSESEIPPESNWIQISPNESGNYLLPLKEGEEITGNYYTVFKYVIHNDTYYGMFCLSTLF